MLQLPVEVMVRVAAPFVPTRLDNEIQNLTMLPEGDVVQDVWHQIKDTLLKARRAEQEAERSRQLARRQQSDLEQTLRVLSRSQDRATAEAAVRVYKALVAEGPVA